MSIIVWVCRIALELEERKKNTWHGIEPVSFVICLCSFYDLVMEMIADRSSAVLDVESDVKLCNIKVVFLGIY